MMTEGYPFVFSMIDYTDKDEFLECTYQYRFKSMRSHHTYIVRVEKYKEHCYCLKFFDKANTLSRNKYSLRSNTFEARTILFTLYHIMLEVLNNDSLASFFFIGAEDEKDEPGTSTRRYRIYRKFVSSIISENKFAHYRDNDLSLYILVNKQVSDRTTLSNKIRNFVKESYTH